MSVGPHKHGKKFRRIVIKHKYGDAGSGKEYLQTICGTCGKVIEELEIIPNTSGK